MHRQADIPQQRQGDKQIQTDKRTESIDVEDCLDDCMSICTVSSSCHILFVLIVNTINN